MAKNNNVLKFRRPASLWGAMWREGLPTGNGTVGCSVYGGAGYDTIVINHNDLWWQGHTGVLPDVSDKIKTTKTALNNGHFEEAEKTLSKALMVKSYRPQLSHPLPLCDLKVTMPVEKMVKDYSRSVNMDNGEVTVTFKDKNTRFERTMFVSRVNDTICYQITKSGPKTIDCDLKLVLHDKFYNRAPSGITQVNDSCDFRAEKGYMYFACRSDLGTDYGAVARVMHVGGSIVCDDQDGIKVVGADKVMVFIKVFVESQKEKEFDNIKKELSLIKLTYEKMLKEHAQQHSKLFGTTELSLGGADVEYVDDLVSKTFNGELPISLMEKLYYFGRYLFVCSVDQDGGPCNPYGLFNGDYKAVDSTRNNYFQTQRLYNFAFNGGLSQMALPLLMSFYNNMDDYKKNATRLYNCKGIYVPSLQAPGSGLLGSVEPGVILNFNVASFVCQMFYEYYLHTDDAKFMKDYGVEFIQETANFYEDLFKLNKTTKYFESPLGYSAYNTPKNYLGKNRDPLCIASNCTVDFVCAKQVFSILVDVAKLGNIDDEEIAKWQDMITKIPDLALDEEGLIKEYNSSAFVTNNNAPYIPHLFPFCIGKLPCDSTRELEKIVATTARARFNNSRNLFTSGNLINIAVALATTGDSSTAYEVLEILTQNFISNNLVFYNTDWRGMGVGRDERWAAYSIDKNTAFSMVMQNMFLNCNKKELALFKNLPQALRKGYLTGLTLAGGIKADLEFNRMKGMVKLKLKSPRNANLVLNLPDNTTKVKGVLPTSVDLEKGQVQLNLQGNKATTLVVRWSNKA